MVFADYCIIFSFILAVIGGVACICKWIKDDEEDRRFHIMLEAPELYKEIYDENGKRRSEAIVDKPKAKPTRFVLCLFSHKWKEFGPFPGLIYARRRRKCQRCGKVQEKKLRRYL